MANEFEKGPDQGAGKSEEGKGKENNVFDFASFKRKEGKPELEKGAEFIIPDFGGSANFGYETKLPWVKIERGVAGHGPSDTGFIKEGNTVTVMGVSDEFGVLCRYNNSSSNLGAELRGGSLFFIDKNSLQFWPELARMQKEERERRAAEVNRILEAEE